MAKKRQTKKDLENIIKEYDKVLTTLVDFLHNVDPHLFAEIKKKAWDQGYNECAGQCGK